MKKLRLKTKAAIRMAAVLKTKLGSVETDKGTLNFVDGDELTIGIEVYVAGDDGENVMPEDGEYAFGDQIAVIKDGIVDKIKGSAELAYEDESVNTLIEIIEEAISTFRGEVDSVKEELRRIKTELRVTKEALTKAKLASARDFTNPNPRSTSLSFNESSARSAQAKRVLEGFGIK